MSLHTSPGCTIAGANEIGTLESNNCDTTVCINPQFLKRLSLILYRSISIQVVTCCPVRAQAMVPDSMLQTVVFMQLSGHPITLGSGSSQEEASQRILLLARQIRQHGVFHKPTSKAHALLTTILLITRLFSTLLSVVITVDPFGAATQPAASKLLPARILLQTIQVLSPMHTGA